MLEEVYMDSWFLLYCKRGELLRAEQNLIRQRVECFYPKGFIEKKVRGKKQFKFEALFPNYIFAFFNPYKISFTTIRSTYGVSDFIRSGVKPIVVNQDLIVTLKSRERLDKKIEEKKQNEAFNFGDQVLITDGPFAGTEAIYKESDGEKRSILLINMMTRQVEIKSSNLSISKL